VASGRVTDYDSVADRYDVRYGRYGYSGVRDTVLSFLGDATAVLEVGCGTGHWLASVDNSRPRRLAGIDPSAPMLDRARRAAPAAQLVRARAEALANMLRDSEISAIYTTEFKRTQQTAAPLAKAFGLTVTTLPSENQAALVAKLRASTANSLVVGHGNTIPDVIKALGISELINISESDYDNLFVVLLGEKPYLIRLHYR